MTQKSRQVRAHGGRRPGAGRPAGPPSVRMRVPENAVSAVRALVAGQGVLPLIPVSAHAPLRRLPFFGVHVPAGFPSPAEQYLEAELDLNELLIPPGHAASTFIMQASGESMIGAGIFDGDLLVVDRAQENRVGSVVVAVHNGEMTVKRLRMRQGAPVLVAEHPGYPDRVISEGDDFAVWGVVVRVLHKP